MGNLSASSSERKSGRRWLLLTFPLIVILILGIEGFFYWQLKEKQLSAGEKTELESQAVKKQSAPIELSLYTEIEQPDGEVLVNIIGKVVEVVPEEAYFILENLGDREKILVNKETRFTFVEFAEGGYKYSENTVKFGSSNLEEINLGRDVTVESFKEKEGIILAESIFVFL